MIHVPFAAARAFLSEYGFGDCRVLLQKYNREPGYGPLLECDADQDDTTNHAAKNAVVMEVTVNDIAPSMPELGRLHNVEDGYQASLTRQYCIKIVL